MAKRGYRKNGKSGRGTGRRALSPRQRITILRAQRVSARRRKGRRSGRAKNNVSYWIGKGVKTVGKKATLGVAGYVADLQDLNEAGRQARKKGQ